MTGNRLHPLAHRLALAACLLLWATCGSSASSPDAEAPLDKDSFGQKYKLASNEAPGWTQSPGAEALLVFTPATLTDKIDGAATPYINKGMQFAMYQILNGPDPQTCNLTAMKFPTEASARSMVADRQTTMSATMTIPGYDSSVASASQALTGITVFASFKDLYLEAVLDGYGSNVESAQHAGATILQAMQAKTK